jgi:shikimate dehydrogenase
MKRSSMSAASTARLAVLGSPIAHSLSPRLHRTAYGVLGLDWSYEAADVTGDRLPAFIAGLSPEWLGLSLTMPLKHDVRALLDSRDELSVLTGATNTVRLSYPNGKRRIEGFNTDVGGIVRALGDAGITRVAQAAVLGGGATAASAVVAAAGLGAEHVTVLARTPERAEPLRAIGAAAGLAVTILPLTLASIELVQGELVLSTLPGDAAPLELIGQSTLPSRSALLDVAYHPWPSRLALLWQQAGRPTVSGLSMLVHQALLQIRVFVAGDPALPLNDEARVLSAMFAALDEVEGS